MCDGQGHVSSQCLSIALLIGKPKSEIPENDHEKKIYIVNPELADTYDKYDTAQNETALEE